MSLGVISGRQGSLSIVIFTRRVFLLGLLLLTDCGVKSSPVAPQTVYPAAISDLHASASPIGINLTWSRPIHYVSGHAMRDLGGFVVLRGEGSQSLQPLVQIPVTDQDRFSPQRTFSYLDEETQVGHSYRYEIISRTLDGYASAPSNEVKFTRVSPHSQNLILPSPASLPTHSP